MFYFVLFNFIYFRKLLGNLVNHIQFYKSVHKCFFVYNTPPPPIGAEGWWGWWVKIKDHLPYEVEFFYVINYLFQAFCKLHVDMLESSGFAHTELRFIMCTIFEFNLWRVKQTTTALHNTGDISLIPSPASLFPKETKELKVD